MTALAVEDVLETIAADAAERDARPAFPQAAFEALGDAGLLTPQPDRASEWALVRAVSKADGSVGRIFEGHFNAYERLVLEGIDPGEHLLGVWGADPLPHEGEPAHIEKGRLCGSKVFCSGAGGLDRALVIAKGTLVHVDLSDVTVDRDWYRAGGMRASESHLVHFDGAEILDTLRPLTRQPYFARDAVRTAACWAGVLDAAVEAALTELAGRAGDPDDLRALAAGNMVTALETVDRWFERAAHDDTVSIQLRRAVESAGATILREAARATGSRPFATGTTLDRARRDFELFILQHRLDPLTARLGRERIEAARAAR